MGAAVTPVFDAAGADQAGIAPTAPMRTSLASGVVTPFQPASAPVEPTCTAGASAAGAARAPFEAWFTLTFAAPPLQAMRNAARPTTLKIAFMTAISFSAVFVTA